MPTSYRSSLSRIGLVWNNLFYPPRDYFVWVLKSFSNWIKLTVTGSHLKLFTLRLQLENKFDFRAKYSKDFFISISNTLSEGFCWTWGFTRYHPLYTISFQKIEQIAIEWSILGVFWVNSEVGSQDYIANLAIFKIWVFLTTFLHESTLYAIDIDKKRFRTPFYTLEPLRKADLHWTQLSTTSETLSYLHLRWSCFVSACVNLYLWFLLLCHCCGIFLFRTYVSKVCCWQNCFVHKRWD